MVPLEAANVKVPVTEPVAPTLDAMAIDGRLSSRFCAAPTVNFTWMTCGLPCNPMELTVTVPW